MTESVALSISQIRDAWRIFCAACEGTGEVDGRQRLAFTGGRARHGDHLELTTATQPFDRQTESLVLFRRERSGRSESHEVRVELCLSHV